MSKRFRVGGRRDKRYFSNTAATVKKINIGPRFMRGGIRL